MPASACKTTAQSLHGRNGIVSDSCSAEIDNKVIGLLQETRAPIEDATVTMMSMLNFTKNMSWVNTRQNPDPNVVTAPERTVGPMDFKAKVTRSSRVLSGGSPAPQRLISLL